MSEREGARDGNIGRASRGLGRQCAGAEVPPFYRLSDRHRERIVVDRMAGGCARCMRRDVYAKSSHGKKEIDGWAGERASKAKDVSHVGRPIAKAFRSRITPRMPILGPRSLMRGILQR